MSSILTTDESKLAVEQLNKNAFVKKFPRVEKTLADPPINLQTIGLFSFIPANGARPDEKGIYGWAKIRGNYSTEKEASDKAEELIRDHDSVHTIYHTYVGRPFPLTVNENFAAETSEIDIRKAMITDISASVKAKKQEDKKLSQEIKDREEELMEDTDPNKDASIVEQDEYITLKVKKAQLSWTYLEHVAKLKEIRGIIMKTRVQIEEADKVNPNLINTFYDKYKSARLKAGFKCDESDMYDGFTRYLVEDVQLPGIDSVEDELVTMVMDMDVKMPAIVVETNKKE